MSVRREWAIRFSIFISFFLIYMLTLTNGDYFTRDTMVYAAGAEGRGIVFHPQHLMYVTVGTVFYRVWQWLGYQGLALYPLQVLSALVGAINAMLFYVTAFRVTANHRAAIAATLFFGFVYGSWRYAVEANPYPLTVTFLLIAFMLLCGSEKRTLRGAGALGAANGLAALFYQAAVILAPVVMGLIWLDGGSVKDKVRRLGAYLGALGLTVGVPYSWVAIAVNHVNTLQGLLIYLTGFQASAGGWLGAGGAISAKSFLKAPIGLGNAFFGELPIFELADYVPPLRHLLLSLVPAAVATEEASGQVAAGLVVILAIMVMTGVLLAVLIAGVGLSFRRMWSSYRPVLITSLAWFVTFGAIAIIWMPESIHHWIAGLIPIVIVLACYVSTAARQTVHPRRALILLLLVALGFFLGNYGGEIGPLRDALANRNVQLASRMRSLARPNDLIITLGAGSFRHAPAYLEYYNGQAVLPLQPIFFGIELETKSYRRHVEAQIQRTLAGGNRVFVLSDVFESTLGYTQLANYSSFSQSKVRQEIDTMFLGQRLQVCATLDDALSLYEVKPPE